MENNELSDLIADAGLAPLAARLRSLIADLGYDLVRLTRPNLKEETLQVMVERPDGSDVTVEDCIRISKAIAPAVDDADPVTAGSALEVSSPGIDRPLTRAKDFTRWAGFEVRLETGGAIGGRTRFHGRIVALEGDRLVLREEAGDIELGLAVLKRAKLVLNDELLAATRRAA